MNNKFIPNSFQTSNSFVDDVLREISGNAVKCYLIIARKTTGWNKTSDNISTKQLKEISGIKKDNTIYSAISELESYGLVVKKVNNRWGNLYSINYDLVPPINGSTEKGDIPKKGSTVLPKKGTSSSTEKGYIQSNTINTNIYKEKIYKKENTIAARISDWKQQAKNEIQPTQDQLNIFDEFIAYWTTHNSTDKKFPAEKQKQFIFKQRWTTWLANAKKWNSQPNNSGWDYLEEVYQKETKNKLDQSNNKLGVDHG